jgi:renalase
LTGAQYFTVRDPRFARAIDTQPGLCKPWSANTVRVLDAAGRVASQGLPTREDPHWVATPACNALVPAWASRCNRRASCTPTHACSAWNATA